MEALQKLLILGVGKMGGSLLNGLVSKNKSIFDISIVEPNLSADNFNLNSDDQIKHYHSIDEIKEKDFDLLLFAVKPQVVNKVCKDVLENLKQTKNFSIISILAGTKVQTYENFFYNSPVIRAMPNLAVSEGSGLTALYSSKNANKLFTDIAGGIFSEVGEIMWIDNEDIMDVITATSGSGPAYYFFLTECLSLIAQDMGLSRENADKLSRQVAIGSSDIMKSSKESISSLREKVTSKGGTTEAALNVLMSPDKEFYNIFKKAIEKACKRGEELSN
jgi:pyrroline-5-carboxylate reductase